MHENETPRCEGKDCSGSSISVEDLEGKAIFIDMDELEDSTETELDKIFIDLTSVESVTEKFDPNRIFIDLDSSKKNNGKKEFKIGGGDEEIEMPTTSTTEVPDYDSNSSEDDGECRKRELSRESVKKYWISSANKKECPKSINEAIFSDQLRRFIVAKLHVSDGSVLNSLEQMERLLNVSLVIMQKNCESEIVPQDFLQSALKAFVVFINEDFFYGIDGVNQDIFQRILEALYNCLGRAERHNLETAMLDCEVSEVLLYLIMKKFCKSYLFR